ncbi:MAG: hypothetical protein GF335_03905 [Candidatus Moranbacteria bacterium]|nr:hypothetical protein [Candidatus Moranbacteria bacterium]
MKSIKTKNFNWLYFENPDKDDLSAIQKIFNPHPVVLGEFNSPTYRPRVVRYNDYIFMVLHFPLFNEKTRIPKIGEIDILFNQEFLATSCSHYQHPLFHFFEQIRKEQGNETAKIPKNTSILLLQIIEVMLNSCFPKLDHITDKLEEIEKQIFLGNEREMVKEISLVKRDILNFRKSIKPQGSILKSLSQNILSPNIDTKARVNDIVGAHIRVWNVLENQKEMIDSLEATNDSLFSHKLNETMKILTVFSIIFLPGTLITGLFGINMDLPLLEFWQVLMVTIGFMLFTLLILKIMKWF